MQAPRRWSYAVIDEAHRLKNRQAVVVPLRRVDECALGAVPRFLTGTPVQQNAASGFALLHFVAPQVYDCAAGFADWLKADAAAAGAASADADADASRLWRPFMLRRLKADHRCCRRSASARCARRSRRCSENGTALSSSATWQRSARRTRALVNVLAALRKCTNHPLRSSAGAEPERRSSRASTWSTRRRSSRSPTGC